MILKSQLIIHNRLLLVTVSLIAFASMIAGAQKQSQQLITYSIQTPDEIEMDTPFQIKVLLSIARDWYIYAPTGTNAAQGMIETKVIFSLPNGLSRVGKMEVPEAHYKDGYEVLQGDIIMHQAFRATMPGEYKITGKITYQSCNSDICLPPVTDEFTTILRAK